MFQQESQHLQNLNQHQKQTNENSFSSGVSFLDECLEGIFPGDFFLFAAKSGEGKTSIITEVALNAIGQGKQVFTFGLEAFKGEFSARILYQKVAQEAGKKNMDFLSWWRGRHPELKDVTNREAEKLAPTLKNLHTFYKERGGFTNRELLRNLNEIRSQADVVILDHVHVMDNAESYKEQQETAQLLLDFALVESKPVIAVSHVRKDDGKAWKVLPDIDDLHGHSDLFKKALQVVILGRDTTQDDRDATLMKVVKSRYGRGNPKWVARVDYNMAKGRYEPGYELGMLAWDQTTRRQTLQTLRALPWWAKSAKSPDDTDQL
jgi:replicative DNA helicase